jgi:hypothetical protein
MSKITAKRTKKIPPCTIDKNLIKKVGTLLENDKSCNGRIEYKLDAKTSDVQASNVGDFIRADWGSDVNSITIRTNDFKSPEVRITFDFHRLFFNKFSVSGENATWVNGITNRLENIIEKNKVKYHLIKTSLIIRTSLAFISVLALIIPIFLFLNSISIIKESNWQYSLSFIIFMFGFWGMNEFIQWLFPYFDYGDSLQKSMRKWIWVILFGSGIVPTIILKLLGF